MSKYKEIHPNFNDDNVILVDESKLKAGHKAELDSAVEAFKNECLKAFSTSKTREVINRSPVSTTIITIQRENRFIDMMHQAVGQSFINNAEVLTNSFQNAMVYALKKGGTPKFTGPCYQQPGASDPKSSAATQCNTGDPFRAGPTFFGA